MWRISTQLLAQLREIGQALAAVVRLTWRASSGLMFGILLLVVVQALLPRRPCRASAAGRLDRAGSDRGRCHAPDRTFQSVAGDRVTGAISEELIRATNRWKGIERFEDPSFADDLERVRQYSQRAGLEVLIDGAGALVAIFTAAGLTLVLIGLHPLAPLVLLLASLPQMAQWWDYNQRTGNHLYFKTPEARRLQYSRAVLLEPAPAKDVRLYNLGGFFSQQYEASFDASMGALARLRTRASLRVSLTAALSALAAGGVFVYVLWQAAIGARSAGDVLLYGGAATLFQARFVELGVDLGFLPRYFGPYLRSLFRVLDAPPDLPLPEDPRQVPRPMHQGIAFENVAFHYPGSSTWVLKGVSFTIRPGEGLALVGHNGAGKTTIVKLLLRLYDPIEGWITLDGVDLRAYDLDDLRSQMGVIFQDFVRYELTARENIGMGQVDALADTGRLLEAARKAGALALIEQLPQGLDTHLGRAFGGRELSGGEWQKLALARAFVRDCQILVLDEPTAALDVQTEHEVYTRFYDLTRDRATLLISHRFSTVRMADHIVVLEDGRVVEQGSHVELVHRGGRYAELFEMQAGRYRE